MILRVDIWSDIACPRCYIGKRRFEEALAQFPHRDAVKVTWHSYQLDPSLPERYDGTEAEYLAQAKGMPAEQVEQMLGQVAEQAAGEGLEFDWDALVPANSMRAHHLLHLAAERGVDVSAVKDDLLSAHFERGQAISDVEVLVEIGGRHGLDAEAVRAAMDDDGIAAAVRGDIQTARSTGITGVPFYVLEDKYAISGAQPADLFGQALQKVWEEMDPKPQPFITLDTSQAPSCGPEGCD